MCARFLFIIALVVVHSALADFDDEPWWVPWNRNNVKDPRRFERDEEVIRCKDLVQDSGEKTKEGRKILKLVRTQCSWQLLTPRDSQPIYAKRRVISKVRR